MVGEEGRVIGLFSRYSLNAVIQPPASSLKLNLGGGSVGMFVMDMVIFRTIFFELLVFFTFTLLIVHSVY